MGDRRRQRAAPASWRSTLRGSRRARVKRSPPRRFWKTVAKATLAGKRNDYEYSVVEQLGSALQGDVKITLLADRGFGDQKFYAILAAFGWDYVIRFRDCIRVTDVSGATKTAAQWLEKTGRAKMLKDVGVTEDKSPVPAVVPVHDKRMKDAWCLATS